MEKVKNHNLLATLLVVFSLVFSWSGQAQSLGDAQKGEELFKKNCIACHKLEGKFVGPPLGGIEARRSNEWLHKWIKNSAALIKSGDEDAIAVFEEYNKVPMLAYEGLLTDQDINDILAYTSKPAEPKKEAQVVVEQKANETMTPSQELVLGAGFVVLLALIFVVFKANRMLRTLAKVNNKEAYLAQHKYFPLWRVFTKNTGVIGVLVAVLFFGSTYLLFGYLMQVGVDQGYQPVQEIHYSHKIHAGDNQIDCKFCHSAARTSKTAGIPSLNVCMNCHMNISEYNGAVDVANGYTKEFYDGEIQKLYAAVGWDPKNMRYTGEEKPVKWTRIHNLPDHVFFDHSQHVTAGKIACQECHGAIQEMEIVYQHASLTMGWCVNCHRQTEVDNTNPYYEKIHEQLAKKLGKDKLTIAELGGLECGKCHY